MTCTKAGTLIDVKVFEMNAKRNKPVSVKGRNFNSLSFRFNGKVSITANEKEIISTSDTITFMPKGVDYSTEIIEDTHAIVLHFDFSEDINIQSPVVITKDHKKAKELFKALIKKFQPDDQFNVHFMSSLYELFSLLDSLQDDKEPSHIPPKIRLAREYIQNECCDPQFSISALSDSLSISSSYLRREFSRAYGTSPIAFLKEMRLYNAKNLLDSEYLSIEEIAEQCGFTSASYFIQFFGKATGMSPSKYRSSK